MRIYTLRQHVQTAMHNKSTYSFLHKQIPLLIVLSIFPGLGYLLLGWINNIFLPAFVWYLLIIVESIWGWLLYRGIDFETMSEQGHTNWYRHISWFFYTFFLLWALIFLIYVRESQSNLHYIAIFTEIGAATVASALLNSDRRLYRPTIFITMVPLIIYFASIGEWYSYVLTIFSTIFTWVLLYAADSSHQLLRKATYQANHDTLTGLHNRHYFIDYLQKRIATLHENHHYSFLLLIDLDHFKTVNDTLGHDVGDHLLKCVGERLRESVSSECVVARLGGDEFMVIGPTFPEQDQSIQNSRHIAAKLLDRLKDIYIIDRHHLYISASIGVSLINDRDVNANNFIKEADIAMYEVKARGRDDIYMFDEEISKHVEKNLEVERLLHFALDREEISLCFQPQVNHLGHVIGAETLVRWSNPQLGVVSPAKFIPIAEQTGLIIELSDFILESAFKTLRTWLDNGISLEQFAINISMRQFTHHNFVIQAERLVTRYLGERHAHKVIFEITESIVAEDITRVIDVMHRLRQLGVRFSMDDFGTGFSSLSYLTRLPIDELKIDQSFIAAIGQHESEKMITTILNLAKTFGLKVVAEGVESNHQRDFLINHDCHYFQGYLFSTPLERQKFEAYYRNSLQTAN